MELLGLEVRAAADDAVLIDLQLAGGAEGDDLVANLDAEPRKVVGAAVGPFHVDTVEALVLPGGLHVLLDGVQFPANGGVDAVLGNEDAPGQAELLAQGALPEPDGVRVSDRSKAVKEHNSV